ncbi:UNVERIFIED_CONTAM: Adenylate isopentenyltransferase 5, chloroplastic [Sesamum indicum]
MAISFWKPALSSMANFSVADMMNKHQAKDKVVVVLGATGIGKSRLAIDLAAHFRTEKGLGIVTNKVSNDECRGVPHHLLGIIDPEAADTIVQKNRLPIIAGGSNSFIQALVSDDTEFPCKYECCFLWMDVAIPMVDSGLVEEGKTFFDPKIRDYDYGIRRAIGVPEMDEFFRSEGLVDSETRAKLLKDEIKMNICKLACYQVEKILRMREEFGWQIHRLNAT